jgi:hypothetical protein
MKNKTIETMGIKESFDNIKRLIKASSKNNEELPPVVNSKLTSYYFVGISFSLLLLVTFILCFLFGNFPIFYIPFSIIPAIFGVFFYKYNKGKINTEGFEVFKAVVIEDVKSPFETGEVFVRAFQKSGFYAEAILSEEEEEEQLTMLFLIPYKKGFIKTPSLVGKKVLLYIMKNGSIDKRGDVNIIDGLLGYVVV